MCHQGTARRLARDIENGSALWEAMERCHFPKLEVALTRAGERAGTLPLACKMLRDYYEEKRSLRTRYISVLAYPLFVYSLAVCVSGLLGVLGQAGGKDWQEIILWLALPWLVFFGWKLFSPILHSYPVSAMVSGLPFFGEMQNHLETSRFLRCFGKALDAGIGMDEAIRLAGDVCVTALYRRRFHRIADKQQDLHLPFSVIAQKYVSWPYDVTAMLQVGEMTGQLPEKAEKSAQVLAERYQKRTFLLLKAVGAIVYLCAVLRVALTVIQFYSGFISSLLQALT